MKYWTKIGSIMLAVLVCIGFALPFALVTKAFIDNDRLETQDRLSAGGFEVDESYVEDRINEVAKENFDIIFKTAAIISLCVVVILFFATLTSPHGLGGINLFNPLSIPLLVIIGLGLRIGISLIFDAIPGQAISELRSLTETFKASFESGTYGLIVLLLVPVLTEITFRGVIVSQLGKVHRLVALILPAIMNAVVVYLAYSSYGNWYLGSSASAGAAAVAALVMGFVLGVVTIRLRSVIPAVIVHIVAANCSNVVDAFRKMGSVGLPLGLLMLVIALAVLVAIPFFFAKKHPAFAYDFPFTAHHERMTKRLAEVEQKKGKKNTGKKAGGSSEKKKKKKDE